MHPRFPFADVGKLRGEIGSRRDFHKHIREVHTRQSRVHFLSQPWKPYPGIGMAEWGPGDMALSLGVPSGRGSVNDPRMQAARAKVFAACKANHIAFLNSFSAADVVDMIKEGVMVGPANEQTADIGRKFTKRQMPW